LLRARFICNMGSRHSHPASDTGWLAWPGKRHWLASVWVWILLLHLQDSLWNMHSYCRYLHLFLSRITKNHNNNDSHFLPTVLKQLFNPRIFPFSETLQWILGHLTFRNIIILPPAAILPTIPTKSLPPPTWTRMPSSHTTLLPNPIHLPYHLMVWTGVLLPFGSLPLPVSHPLTSCRASLTSEGILLLNSHQDWKRSFSLLTFTLLRGSEGKKRKMLSSEMHSNNAVPS